jgi:hypothetical protein
VNRFSKLDRISRGISVSEALEFLCDGCSSGWSLLSKQQQYAHIRELRTLLSDPLSAEQAEALRAIAGGAQTMEEVLDWLRHQPMRRSAHRRMLVRRVLSELGPPPGLPAQGFSLDFRGGDRYQHTFCGPHDIAGAGCPNCRKPLLRLLSLDTSDPRLRLGRPGFASLHLLYCWTCAIPSDQLVYRLRPGSAVELLYFGRGRGLADLPYAGYPEYFSGRPVTLRPLSRRRQDLLRVFNAASILAPTPGEERLLEPRHQVGGEPYLIEPLKDVLCQVCSRHMPMLASICDNAAGPAASPGYADTDSFTHNAEIQVIFHYCRRCRVVAAYHLEGWDGFSPVLPEPHFHYC